MHVKILIPLAAAGLLSALACGPTEPESQRPGDGAYRYVLGVDPVSGESIIGGVHKVVEITNDRGKSEAIDYQNRPSKLHPDLAGDEYARYDATLSSGETNWDVFASNWWPQSKNGTAWRWQPGANQDYADLSDRERLAPLEKYDVLFYPGQSQSLPEIEHCEYGDYVENGADDCTKIKHPAVTVAGPATAWEMKNQGTYQTYEPESWWGHCNGWASYATAEPLGWPKRDVRVKLVGDEIKECSANEASSDDCVLFKMADVEALMTELYFSDQATFAGRRCNTRPDKIERDEYGRPTETACRDLNAASLHMAMTGLLGKGARNLVTNEQDQRPAFVIDHNYDYQVWNFPLVKYAIDSAEELTEEQANTAIGATGSDYTFNSQATKFVKISGRYWMVSDGVGAYQLLKPAGERAVPLHPVTIRYILELDANDKILGGEWLAEPWASTGDKNAKADFMWMAINPVGWGESADDRGGSSDNPHVSYPMVQAILRCANEPESCNDEEPPPPPVGLCENQCGNGPFQAPNGQSCYCDEACLSYNDCCDGYAEACSEEPPPPPVNECEDGGGTCESGDTCSNGVPSDLSCGDGSTDLCCVPGEPPPPPAASCEGHCGSSSPVPGSSPACYCDDACDGYGDCCDDKVDLCGAA